MDFQFTSKTYFALGTFVSIIILVGLFAPWLIHQYEPYPVLNPKTRQGERHYHSKILLSPFYVSKYENGVFISRVWFPSIGTVIAGLFILSVAILSIGNFTRYFSSLLIISNSFIGIVLFFLSLGFGVSIGWKNQVGWGLTLTLLGLIFAIILSFIEITEKELPKFMDFQ